MEKLNHYLLGLGFTATQVEGIYNLEKENKLIIASVSGNNFTIREEFKQPYNIRYILKGFRFEKLEDIDFVIKRLFPLHIDVLNSGFLQV